MQEAKPRKSKQIWQFVYIFATLAIIVALGVANPELAPLFHGELTVDGFWLALCGAAMLGYWLLQACVYGYAGRMVGAPTSFLRSVSVTLFGEYYSALTPFSSGGQPMQLGYYRRYGVSLPKATSILAIRYIGYLGAVCLCFLTAFALEGRHILATFPLVFWLTTLGFAVNAFTLVMVVLLMIKPAMARSIGAWCIRTITRVRFLQKKREKWLAAYEHGIEEYTAAVACVRSHPGQCVVTLLLSLASVVSQFSVTYFVYRAVGLTEATYAQLFSMQIYLYLAVSFAPTPGASGATEGGFYLFFAMLFPKTLLYSAMLLWRIFTYYSTLLVGAGMVIANEVRALRRPAAATEKPE